MSELVGPPFFDNWRAWLTGAEPVATCEYPLFSDAWLVGAKGFGPYTFFNTIAHASGSKQSPVAPVIVLRLGIHMQYELPQWDKTDVDRYHGGLLEDEVASLTSLAMGIRVKSGRLTRTFEPGDLDPRGKPVAYFGYESPALLRSQGCPVLPWAVGSHSFEDLRWIEDWFETDPRDQIALIRAARLHQEAMWIAEAEPAMAWLLFVSAIETAADSWDRSDSSNIDRLRDSRPELVSVVEMRCPDLVSFIADQIANSLGATRKFLTFTLRFLPSAPSARPPEFCQVLWEPNHLKRVLGTIYSHRSDALHAGIPFPLPMCEPPGSLQSDWSAPAEKPLGLAASARGAVWRERDMPMHRTSSNILSATLCSRGGLRCANQQTPAE